MIITLLHFVVGREELAALKAKASSRLHTAYRPKTRRCYQLLFRNFLGFCICSDIDPSKITLHELLAYFEYLSENGVSCNMLPNNISALKANFIMYTLQYELEKPQVSLFVKATRINRPLAIMTRNIMSIDTLKALIAACDVLTSPYTFKAIFLIAFFGFLRISNIAPHSFREFDPSRHLTMGDIQFNSPGMLITLKWSKTMQSRDKVHVIALPSLYPSPLCPVRALKRAIAHYKPKNQDPLFQVCSPHGHSLVTESKLRKTLSKLNIRLGFPPHHFSFHTFRRSGASCAYNAHVPVQSIKTRGSWASNCVWTYIQQDQKRSLEIAQSFKNIITS